MKELIIIRHAEAVHLTMGLTGGWTDSKLTDKGFKQAKLTGKRLVAELHGTLFNYFCSDLTRAIETARVIGDMLGTEPVLKKAFRELNNGDAVNITLEEAKSIQIPKTYPLIDWTPYTNAESWRMLHNRIQDTLELLKKEVKYDKTVIISHGNSIQCMINWFLGIPIEMMTSIGYDIDLCSISKLRIASTGEKTISTLNNTSHLLKEYNKHL